MQAITVSMDVNLLYSLINMKLRNEYQDLHDLCLGLDLDQTQLVEKLASKGYHFCEESKQFRLME